MDYNIFLNVESLKTSCRELPQDSKNNTTIPMCPRITGCRSRNKENLKYEFLLSVVDETGLLKDDLQVKSKVWTRERRLEYFDKKVKQTVEDSKK